MNDHLIHQNRIRQVFFIVLIALLGLLLFSELYTFLPALLGAVTLYIVMRRWMFHLTIKKKWRKGWTAALLMLLSMIVILLPIALLINMLSSKITFAIQHSDELVGSLKKIVTEIEQKFKIKITRDENINRLGDFIRSSIPKLLGALSIHWEQFSLCISFFILCW
jgi:predicted PurR-regulated permease PerM